MTRKEYQAYLRSEHWLEFRAAYFRRKGYKRCVECGSTEEIQLHHLTYKRLGEEKFKDVQALCRRCHVEKHNRAYKKRPRVRKVRGRKAWEVEADDLSGIRGYTASRIA